MFQDNNIFFHIPFEYIEKFSRFIIERKMNLEIYFRADVLDESTPAEYQKVSSILSENRIKSTFHAPFMDLSPGGIDSKVRKISLLRMKQVLKAASFFHPLSIVVHSGYDRWRFATVKDEWIKKSVSTWKEILNILPFDDIVLCLENVFEDNPSTLIELCRKMKSKNFKICFDTGHFNLFSTISLSEWIGLISPYLGEIHLHDNSGKSDEHNAIGSGTVNFVTLFKLIKPLEKPILTVEAHSSENVLKSIERLDNILTESGFNERYNQKVWK